MLISFRKDIAVKLIMKGKYNNTCNSLLYHNESIIELHYECFVTNFSLQFQKALLKISLVIAII